MGKAKFNKMLDTFRRMTRAADNETLATRTEFVGLIDNFERAYADWRGGVPEYALREADLEDRLNRLAAKVNLELLRLSKMRLIPSLRLCTKKNNVIRPRS